MSLPVVILATMGGLLSAMWVASALTLLIGLRRVKHAWLKGLESGGRTSIVGLILLGATLMTVNAVTVLVGRVWYKVRGKPLP